MSVALIVDDVRTMIRMGSVSSSSVISIIRAVANVSPSWDVIETVVRELAKGPDGIAGTSDDLIPQATLDALSSLVSIGAVRDMLEWVKDAAAAAANTADTAARADTTSAGCSLWPCCF